MVPQGLLAHQPTSAAPMNLGSISPTQRILHAHAAMALPRQVQQRRSNCAAPVQASLVTSVAETATLAAAVGGLALSALPLLTGEARECNERRPVNTETSEEDFVFGVMSAVSFLPYVNWTVGLGFL